MKAESGEPPFRPGRKQRYGEIFRLFYWGFCRSWLPVRRTRWTRFASARIGWQRPSMVVFTRRSPTAHTGNMVSTNPKRAVGQTLAFLAIVEVLELRHVRFTPKHATALTNVRYGPLAGMGCFRP